MSNDLRPRDVPGYQRAVEAGVVRPPPRTTPGLLPGRTAAQCFNRFLLQGAAGVGAWLVVLAILNDYADGAVAAIGTVLAGLALLGGVMASLARVGARVLDELSHGYTTLTLEFGTFWIGALRRWPRFGHRVPWEYSGTWVLDNTGAIVSEPEPSNDAPGLYPSPNRPGALELWTGAVWSGDYRDPPA